MSKIVLILGSNIHWAPYYYRYEEFLNKKNIKFDLIMWNRENIKEKICANKIFEYKKRDISDNKNPLKIFKFFEFAKFIKKTIAKEGYSKIIFLGTHACAHAILCEFLSKNYKGKYWIDIRDYQYEWFLLYYLMQKKAINNSFTTVISSKGYEQFLPKYNYKYIHNIDNNMLTFVKKYNKEENKFKIRIGFIGNVRYIEENIKLINIFANDDRYILQYFGTGSEKIKKYAKSKNINNVITTGKFQSIDTIKYYNQIDIINNVYGNNMIGLTTALSNKLYFSIYLNIPLLVCQGTYMEQLVNKYKIGFVYKNNKNFADELYNDYQKYIKCNKKDGYRSLKLIIEEEEKETFKALDGFVNDWSEN